MPCSNDKPVPIEPPSVPVPSAPATEHKLPVLSELVDEVLIFSDLTPKSEKVTQGVEE